MERKQESSLKEKIVSACNIPSDVVLGYPIITMTGNRSVVIESYRGIIEYRVDMIRIQTKSGQIKVLGKSLNIEYYTSDEMKIEGCIASIEFI